MLMQVPRTLSLFSAAILLAASTLSASAASDDYDTADIERGAYLVNAIAGCGGCHTPPNESGGKSDAVLSGQIEPQINMPNITPDIETGIGSWTAEHIETAIRAGVRPDGSLLHPVMPWKFYERMEPADIRAIVGYLQSVPAVTNEIPPNTTLEGRFPAAQFTTPPEVLPEASADEKVVRGSYLVNVAHCMRCHTPLEESGIDYDNQLGAGGRLMGGEANPAVSANLTPHADDGIAHYSVADIAQILRTGQRLDGSDLAPIMGKRPLINDADMEAIALYLKAMEPRPFPEL